MKPVCDLFLSSVTDDDCVFLRGDWLTNQNGRLDSEKPL